MSRPLPSATSDQPVLARAIGSDCDYFDMGAELMPLDGATLAWMPGLTRSPAAAVIHQVNQDALTSGGTAWITAAEAAMASINASLSRIYLVGADERAGRLLSAAGYVARDELVFVGSVPPSPLGLSLRRVDNEADWARKLRFHVATDETPDGHGNRAADWVELERRKCRAGMESYLAVLDDEIVGAVGAIWYDGFLRTKNIVVARDRRRRGIGRAMLGCIAELGRKRGISEQCVLAVRGEDGELRYRAAGMAMIGLQVEWSRPIASIAR